MNKLNDLSGAWSAAPTPMTESLKIDSASVKRMIKHHIRLKQRGVFIGGTCGEGPFLPEKEFRELTNQVTKSANRNLIVAVQVTDNSYSRVLHNIVNAKADGADIGIIAEPWFGINLQKPDVLKKYYLEAADKSPIPVGIYSRGLSMPIDVYRQLLLHPNVVLFKDSSVNDEIKKVALEVLKERPEITVLTGYELNMAPYLIDGYSGVLAGGGILIGALTTQMIDAAKQGDNSKVLHLQKHCDKINYAAYGGKKIVSWLTGLKYTLVRMGIFTTTAGYLQYPLPASVKAQIDKMIKKEKTILLP